MAGRLFTSESVTEGHPDKIADQISDTILDYLIEHDPTSRVAVETLLTTGLVVVAGEVTTSAYAPIAQLVRQKVLEIGYDSSEKGFDGNSCGVQVAIGSQSADIAQGVDDAFEERVDGSGDELDRQGAGDQGLMFGYACDDTPELFPLPIKIAQTACRAPHRRCARTARCPTCVPTARPRSPSSTTRTTARSASTPSCVSSQHAEDVSQDQLPRTSRSTSSSRSSSSSRTGARPRATSSTSTRPAASSSVARWATPA